MAPTCPSKTTVQGMLGTTWRMIGYQNIISQKCIMHKCNTNHQDQQILYCCDVKIGKDLLCQCSLTFRKGGCCSLLFVLRSFVRLLVDHRHFARIHGNAVIMATGGKEGIVTCSSWRQRLEWSPETQYFTTPELLKACEMPQFQLMTGVTQPSNYLAVIKEP